MTLGKRFGAGEKGEGTPLYGKLWKGGVIPNLSAFSLKFFCAFLPEALLERCLVAGENCDWYRNNPPSWIVSKKNPPRNILQGKGFGEKGRLKTTAAVTAGASCQAIDYTHKYKCCLDVMYFFNLKIYLF